MGRAAVETLYRAPLEASALPKPKLVPVAEMVKEGTVGFLFVSKTPTLGPRPRAAGMFRNQTIESLWADHRPNDLPTWESMGFKTVEQILDLDPGQFALLPSSPILERGLRRHLKGELLTPQAKLLADVFHTSLESMPLDIGREEGLRYAVDQRIDQMLSGSDKDKLQAEILIRNYGLRNGAPQAMRNIAGELDMAEGKVNGEKIAALQKLRRPRRNNPLKAYINQQDTVEMPEEADVVVAAFDSNAKEKGGVIFSIKDYKLPRNVLFRNTFDIPPDLMEQLKEVPLTDLNLRYATLRMILRFGSVADLLQRSRQQLAECGVGMLRRDEIKKAIAKLPIIAAAMPREDSLQMAPTWPAVVVPGGQRKTPVVPSAGTPILPR